MKTFLSITLLFVALPAYSAEVKSRRALDQIAVRGMADGPSEAPDMATKVPERYWVVVRCASKQDRSRLAEIGMDVAEVGKGVASGVVSQEILDAITKAGFKVQFRTGLDKYNRSQGRDFPEKDSAYHNYDEQSALLADIAKHNEGMASVGSAGKSDGGMGISVIKIGLPNPKYDSLDPKAPKKPAIALVGQHHAREHISAEVPLSVASFLAANKSDPKIKKLLEEVDVYIIPSVNPDGGAFDVATGRYRMWRKNTRKLPDGNIGVDLNRNYDSYWCQQGASHYTGADTYCGPAPFSEPETQTVKAFFDSHPEVTMCIAYHSYGGIVMYPWGGTDANIGSAKDLEVFTKMTEKVAGFTGFDPQKSSDMYVAGGDFADWAYAAHKVFALTIELPPGGGSYGGFYPGPEAIGATSPGNIDAVVFLMGFADDPYRLLEKEPKSILDLAGLTKKTTK